MEERALTEKLIAYDTSGAEGVRLAAGFVKGCLEARDIEARQLDVRGLPITVAEVGPPGATTVLFHGHLDVVPGRPGQFEPHADGERLIGRGAYDMKGALAAMLLALHDLRDTTKVRIRLGVVPDEAPPRGWATMQSSRLSRCFGASSRYLLPSRAPSFSTARRSISDEYSAGTRSTRCPTLA